MTTIEEPIPVKPLQRGRKPKEVVAEQPAPANILPDLPEDQLEALFAKYVKAKFHKPTQGSEASPKPEATPKSKRTRKVSGTPDSTPNEKSCRSSTAKDEKSCGSLATRNVQPESSPKQIRTRKVSPPVVAGPVLGSLFTDLLSKHPKSDVPPPTIKKVGTKLEVWNGLATMTPGGLTKDGLMVNVRGKVISKKAHACGNNLMARLKKP